MPSLQHLFLADPYVQKLIRRKAREMVGQFGFAKADQEDIEQELRLDILNRCRRYDCTKSSIATFSNRVITHRIASIIAERKAECRDWQRLISLHDPAPGAEDSSSLLEDRLDASGGMSPRKPGCSPEHAAADLRMDMSRILAILPPAQRDFCLRLQEQTIAEIAAETGIPASTLYDMRRKIRQLFRELKENSEYIP